MCLGQHSCMNSTFYTVILNGTVCFFRFSAWDIFRFVLGVLYTKHYVYCNLISHGQILDWFNKLNTCLIYFYIVKMEKYMFSV